MAASIDTNNKEVGFLKTCINGINALSGIGILSVPYALSSAGWLSLLILVVIAITALFTGHLLRRCMDLDPEITSYSDIAGRAFGKKGRIIVSILTSLELYLVATGFLILEGDNLHKLSPEFSIKLGGLDLGGRHSFVILTSIMILPSMLFNDLGLLSYVSAGGVLSSLVILFSVLSVGLSKGVGFHPSKNLFSVKGIPSALSLYTFCYGAHAVFPTIYSSMKKKSQFPKVLLLSFVICTIIYVAMAILGYLIYGQNVQSQITLNLPLKIAGSKVAIYTVLAGPIAKYALTVMPIATAIERFFPARYHDQKWTRIALNMILLTSTAVLAIVFPSFHSLASLIGAVLCVLVSFLFPCILYMKIFEVYKERGLELVCILAIMLLSVLAGALGTYSTVSQFIKH